MAFLSRLDIKSYDKFEEVIKIDKLGAHCLNDIES